MEAACALHVCFGTVFLCCVSQFVSRPAIQWAAEHIHGAAQRQLMWAPSPRFAEEFVRARLLLLPLPLATRQHLCSVCAVFQSAH